MKPGMQRDLLAAFWFLFDEFEIGDDANAREVRIPEDPAKSQKTAPTASQLPSHARRTDRPS